MGNCQAVDAAALVVQHPNGKTERMYWSITASEVMKMNPGHYVSIIIPVPPVAAEHNSSDDKTVRFTRVKLLRPTETLVLGRAYRLVTIQEVVNVLRAKKYAKMKKNQSESMRRFPPESENQDSGDDGVEKQRNSELESNCQVTRRREIHHHLQRERERERERERGGVQHLGGSKSKSWRPSLNSIAETAS